MKATGEWEAKAAANAKGLAGVEDMCSKLLELKAAIEAKAC